MRRFTLSRLAVLVVSLCVAGAALADTPKLVLGRYEGALKLMDQGQCDQAREILFPGGKAAKGDEVAIGDIGDCYLKMPPKPLDPAELQKRREIGAGWILRGANLGLREAQATAVKIYLDGTVFFVDPYEAAKWYLLWQVNRSQMQLGQVEFNLNLTKQLNAFGNDVWVEAQARAKVWTPTVSREFQDAP